MTLPRNLLLAFALLLGASVLAAADEPDAEAVFERQIAPLLAGRCLECHSGAEPAGHLDLTNSDKMLSGGESGPAVVPGKPEESLLWQYVESGEMPPPGKRPPLDGAEKERLRTWIAGGAVWGSAAIDPLRYTSDRRAGLDWWSLQPVRRPEVPAASNSAWTDNPIDAFVLRQLDQHGLAPSPPAAPRTLVRRLYFDLIGLPPPADVVRRFESDPSEVAYRQLVDELLASPHYGERWARHWLDVVRYGESDGFERNMPRREAWPYRDWIVEALNADMPYDQFARLQIAGDIIAPEDSSAIAATGFLVAGIHNTVVANNDMARAVARHDEWEDQVATIGQALLGLTVQCARCHDHKFDPIGQRDYYRFVAALAGVEHGERNRYGANEQQRRKEKAEQLEQQRGVLAQQLAALESLAGERAAKRQGRGDQAAVWRSVAPLARWSFADDARDSCGNLHGELQGGAIIEGGRLVLNGTTAFVRTAPLEQSITEKTFEAWLRLNDLQQRGGGAITLQTLDGATFDSLVYGEREPRRWMAGSNFFQRTRDVGGPDEKTAGDELVHMAVVYAADGHIQLYRNGQPYGVGYRPDGEGAHVQRFEARSAQVVLGLRHTGGGNPWLAGEIDEARLYDRALSADELAASHAAGPDAGLVPREAMLAEMTAQEREQHAQWTSQLAQLKSEIAGLSQSVKIYAALASAPPPVHVLQRGSVSKPLDLVAPAGLACVGDADFGLTAEAPDGERRRRLAEWIASSSNPLFSRVIVNRLWHHHFGVGLVDTPSDFGFNGGRPSHAELLDWLAAELVANGFHLKPLHRQIVTSRTYRQSGRYRAEAAAQDADNRWLWRRSPQRLEAEVVRDSILAVAGQLRLEVGGRPYEDVRTYFNAGTTYYEPIATIEPEFQRRTLYRFSPRGERSPLLDTFDCPDPSVSTPRRQVTTTPLQALAMLNDQLVLTMAKESAHRIEQVSGDKVVIAFRLALQRDPNAAEHAAAAAFVERHGMAALARALFNSNEFVIVE